MKFYSTLVALRVTRTPKSAYQRFHFVCELLFIVTIWPNVPGWYIYSIKLPTLGNNKRLGEILCISALYTLNIIILSNTKRNTSLRTAFHKQTTIKMFRSFCCSRSKLLHKRSAFLTKRTKVGLDVSGTSYKEFDSQLSNENFNELVAHKDRAIIYDRSVISPWV